MALNSGAYIKTISPTEYEYYAATKQTFKSGSINGPVNSFGLDSSGEYFYNPCYINSSINLNAWFGLKYTGNTSCSYILPTTYPDINGYVLSCTTDGIMSWILMQGSAGEQPLNTNLTNIGGVSPSIGWLHYNGSSFEYSTPS